MTNQAINFDSIIANLLPTPYVEFEKVCKDKEVNTAYRARTFGVFDALIAIADQLDDNGEARETLTDKATDMLGEPY